MRVSGVRFTTDDPILEHQLLAIGSGKSNVSDVVELGGLLDRSSTGGRTSSMMSGLDRGGWGNGERNLQRFLKNKKLNDLETYPLPITLKSKKGERVPYILECLAPYEVFSALYENWTHFGHCIFGTEGEEGVLKFWGGECEEMKWK